VLLSEPTRTPYDLRFSVLGVPVRVHPFFWLITAILGARGNSKPAEVLLWVATVFVSILIHELGHALTARAFGWEPWITLYGMGGLASYRPTRQSHWRQIVISLAGPGAGFLFAALIVAGIAASGHPIFWTWPESVLPIATTPFFKSDGTINVNLTNLVGDLLFVNIFWGLINLLPMLPLDGGRIAESALQIVDPRDGVQKALWLSIFVAIAAAAFAYLRLQDTFLILLCAYLAYTNFVTLQSLNGGNLGGYR
jgi:membrane-associated protease RseP (regulator of RpoE activity)